MWRFCPAFRAFVDYRGRVFCAKLLQATIQFSESTVSMSKTVQFQIIHFRISTQFKCKYGLIEKNISISTYSVLIQLIQFSISTDFVYTQLHVKNVPCQTIQFGVNTV